MKNSFSSLLLSTLSAAVLLWASAAPAEDASKAEIEGIVKEVIRDNPELIAQTMENYRKKKEEETAAKAAQQITELQAKLKKDTSLPSIGNPKGDVTLVEFFDYHCGYCKRFLPVISQLVEDDHKIRLVFMEFPILSEDSGVAAKAALVVNSIDKSKYFAFHTALMKMNGEFTLDNLTEKAKSVGIDEDAFKKGMANPAFEKELSANKDLAYTLNIHGTPAIVVGNQLVPGVIPIADLKAKIAAARAANKL